MVTLGANLAYAKKEPKYETMHQLTPDQAALVEKAIGREKVIIKNIQQRTPLVETLHPEHAAGREVVRSADVGLLHIKPG